NAALLAVVGKVLEELLTDGRAITNHRNLTDPRGQNRPTHHPAIVIQGAHLEVEAILTTRARGTGEVDRGHMELLPQREQSHAVIGDTRPDDRQATLIAQTHPRVTDRLRGARG